MLFMMVVGFGFCLLLLGGRGRVIWPLVGIVAWAVTVGYLRISFIKGMAVAILCGVLLQTLDPLILYWNGYEDFDAAISRLKKDLSLGNLFLSRNFDSFHNLAVIVVENRIPADLSYLIFGCQTQFLMQYFPEVYARGVGYPATLPGALWIAGRYPLVIAGGFVFGIFFSFLTWIYSRLKSELEVVAYCVSMPFIAHIGTSYVDSYLKFASVIMPGLCVALLMRNRTNRLARLVRVRYGYKD